MTLEEIIIQKILSHGPISFRDFMENALYHNVHGYYESERVKIGHNGDYYTSPVIDKLFAMLISRQIEEMWRIAGTKEFNIIEFGAGNGALCKGILSALCNHPFYPWLQYSIIER